MILIRLFFELPTRSECSPLAAEWQLCLSSMTWQMKQDGVRIHRSLTCWPFPSPHRSRCWRSTLATYVGYTIGGIPGSIGPDFRYYPSRYYLGYHCNINFR